MEAPLQQRIVGAIVLVTLGDCLSAQMVDVVKGELTIIFTKADKLNKSTLPKNIAAYKKELLNYWEELPPYFISSSTDKTGRDEILNFIQQVNDSMK